MKRRKGRAHGRPLDDRKSMHLVLRSSHAKADWSFRKPKNKTNISLIINKFSKKYGVKILSLANVGNHLHFHIKLTNRHTYRPFIRAITSAIAMAVTGMSRWNRLGIKFWDYRPFTRIVNGLKAYLNLRDYIHINQLEGLGCDRLQSYLIVKSGRFVPSD